MNSKNRGKNFKRQPGSVRQIVFSFKFPQKCLAYLKNINERQIVKRGSKLLNLTGVRGEVKLLERKNMKQKDLGRYQRHSLIEHAK